MSAKRGFRIAAAVAMLASACGGRSSPVDVAIKRVGTKLVLKNGAGVMADAVPTAAGPAEALTRIDAKVAFEGLPQQERRARLILDQSGRAACPAAPTDERPEIAAGPAISSPPKAGTYIYGNTGKIDITAATIKLPTFEYPALTTMTIKDIRPYVKAPIDRPADEAAANGHATAKDKAGVDVPTVTVPPVVVPDTPDVPTVTTPNLPVQVPYVDPPIAPNQPFDPFQFTMASALGALASELTWGVTGVKDQNIHATYTSRTGIVLVKSVLRAGATYTSFEPTPELVLIPLPLQANPQTSDNVDRNNLPEDTSGVIVNGQTLVPNEKVPYPPGTSPQGVDYAGTLGPYAAPASDQTGRPVAEDWSSNTASDGYGTTETAQTRVYGRQAVDVCGMVFDTWQIGIVEDVTRTDPVDSNKTYKNHSVSVIWLATQFGGLVVRKDVLSTSTSTQHTASGADIPIVLTVSSSSTLRSIEPLAKA